MTRHNYKPKRGFSQKPLSSFYSNWTITQLIDCVNLLLLICGCGSSFICVGVGGRKSAARRGRGLTETRGANDLISLKAHFFNDVSFLMTILVYFWAVMFARMTHPRIIAPELGQVCTEVPFAVNQKLMRDRCLQKAYDVK